MADVVDTASVVLKQVLETGAPDMALVKQLISQLLGYAILTGALVTKLPQILLIRRARTAEGLSTIMFEVETYTLLVAALYGYVRHMPFNTYGESAILAVQNLIILSLVYAYSGAPLARRGAAAAVYVALVASVLQGHLPAAAMNALAEANTLVVMCSRLPQVAKNFAARSTGALSGITAGINVLGCLVRLFTTVQSGGGAVMLRGYIVSLIINGTLLLQIIAYAKNTAAVLKARKEEAAGAAQKKEEAKKEETKKEK